MEKQEKELDLLDVITYSFNFISKYVFIPLINIIKLGLRKWYILLSSLIVALLLSIVVPRYILKKNSSEIVIKTNVAVSTDYINELEAISKLEPEKLAKTLELDLELAEEIIDIRPHRILSYDTIYVNTFIDRNDVYDKLRADVIIHPKSFVLEVVAKDIEDLPIINDAIINYLNNTSTFASFNESRLLSLNKELKTYQKEIKVLDSIRSRKYFENNSSSLVLDGSGGIFSMKEKEEDKVQNTILDLSRRIITIEAVLHGAVLAVEQGSAITLTKEKFTDVFKKYSLACFILAYVLLILCTYKKEIINWINTDNK